MKTVAELRLTPETRGTIHAFFRALEQDPALIPEGEAFIPYCYDPSAVDARFDALQKRRDKRSYAILSDGAVIGNLEVKHIDAAAKSCELGICLVNDGVKNRGHGTEALRLGLRLCFETLGMERVMAKCLRTNTRSLHVLNKLGFRPTGGDERFRYFALTRGQFKEIPVPPFAGFLDTGFLFSERLRLVLERTVEADPAKGWLPAYHFQICLPDGERLGACSLRVGYNENTYYGGNIGYGVDEPYRGRHYAEQACRLLFTLAKKHGLGYLLINCDPENLPSRRTCERLGGALLEIAELPADNDMRLKNGQERVCVFRFDL